MMTIRQLTERLSEYDPEMQVAIIVTSNAPDDKGAWVRDPDWLIPCRTRKGDVPYLEIAVHGPFSENQVDAS